MSYDLKGSSLDGGAGVVNCLLVWANTLGIQAALPADGGVPGATLEFRPGTGEGGSPTVKGAFWTFPTGGDTGFRRTTDKDGKATIDVAGLHQLKVLPDTAREWDREATIGISATPEAEDERSIANMFVDSLLLAGGPAGAIAPIVDYLKILRYDLGDFAFLVTDWQDGWTYGGGLGIAAGTKCDGLGGAWDIKLNTNQSGVEYHGFWHATIDEKTMTGTYLYDATQVTSQTNGDWKGLGGGTATVTPQADGSVKMLLKGGRTRVTIKDNNGTTTQELTDPGWTFHWKADNAACTTP